MDEGIDRFGTDARFLQHDSNAVQNTLFRVIYIGRYLGGHQTLRGFEHDIGKRATDISGQANLYLGLRQGPGLQ